MLFENLLFVAAKWVIGFYARFFLRLNVDELSTMPDGARIVAANHPTLLDPFLVAFLLKKRSYILITGQAFKNALAGFLLRKLGHVPVIAGSGQEAISRALELLQRGETIVIFPEGDFSPAEGGFGQARTGVARLALASGAPVIPLGIHLDYKKVKRTDFIIQEEKATNVWYQNGPYYVTAGKPQYYAGDVENHARVRQVANNIMQHIVSLAYTSEKRMVKLPVTILPQPVQD